MLDVPMTVAIERLPLADTVRQALIDGSGELGQTLATALAYERGEWGQASLPGVPASRVREAFLEAVEWSRSLQHPQGRSAA
jgi:c-di-GMP-related signal transduction protein